MKKILQIATILLIIAGNFSCGIKNKENDTSEEDNIYQQKILGKWKLEAWYEDTPIDIDEDGNASVDLMSQWNGCWKQSVLEFSKEFDYVKIIYTGPDNNPRCPSGFKTNDFSRTPPWTIRKTTYLTLIFQGDDYQDTYEISELSDEILLLKGSGFLTCCDPNISYYTKGYLKFIRIE